MRISPSLLLFLLLIFIFTPTIHGWIMQGGSHWYRPYLVWFFVVVMVYLNQRGSHSDGA